MPKVIKNVFMTIYLINAINYNILIDKLTPFVFKMIQ